MANIGDLFMRVVADLKGFSTQVTKEATVAGDKASASFGARFKKGVSQAGTGAKGGLLAGLGLGTGLGVVGLASKAIGTLTDIAFDSIKAFNEDQQSIQAMGTALKAAIPGWNGNTDAIEKVIAAQMALGFSDDEQRQSIAQLAAATHDITKAMALERTAMDLARFSHISLADAGDQLIKVQAGQFKSLKSLGIVLKKGATAEDALAAVQKVVAGGAEDFAQTNEGKLLVSQVKVNEAMERLGSVLAGPVADAQAAFADGLTEMVKGVGNLGDSLDGLDKSSGSGLTKLGVFEPIVQGAITAQGVISRLSDVLPGTVQHMNTMGFAAKAAGDKAGTALGEEFSSHVTGSLDDIGLGMDYVARRAEHMKDDVVKSGADLVKALGQDAQDIIDQFFDPIELRADLHDTRHALHVAAEQAAAAKTKAAYREAAAAVEQALDDEGTKLRELGDQGKLTKDDVDTYNKDIKKAYADMGKKVPAEIQKVLDSLYTLAHVSSPGININVSGGFGNKNRHDASGGPLDLTTPTWVGEFGRELIVPTAGGPRVLSHTQSVNATSGSGMRGDTTYITVGRADRQTIGEIRREMRASSARKRMAVSSSGGGLG